ncbi:MAG TPA: RcnB family protein [Terracidiphilus sp.]|jgi:Ni/Co efflux regulator RcnB
MKKLHTILALAFLSTSLTGGIALAQDHHDDHPSAQDRDHHDNHAYVEHKDWKRGARMDHDDWNRGERIDYHDYHLAAPPRGYEWRMVDGYYVLANISNFQIRTVVRIQ